MYHRVESLLQIVPLTIHVIQPAHSYHATHVTHCLVHLPHLVKHHYQVVFVLGELSILELKLFALSLSAQQQISIDRVDKRIHLCHPP